MATVLPRHGAFGDGGVPGHRGEDPLAEVKSLLLGRSAHGSVSFPLSVPFEFRGLLARTVEHLRSQGVTGANRSLWIAAAIVEKWEREGLPPADGGSEAADE